MKNSIENLITDAIKKISDVADVNMIVGSPVTATDGSTIIPISKITIGFLSGGGEYGKIKISKNGQYPYSGASGGVLSIKPSGFLINKKNGVKYVHCPSDVFEKAIDTCEDLLKNANEKTSKN